MYVSVPDPRGPIPCCQMVRVEVELEFGQGELEGAALAKLGVARAALCMEREEELIINH